MQSESIQLDVAVNLLTKTEAFLKSYRKTGFASAQTTAREFCEEMNVEAVLKQKRLRKTKHHFSYESPDEPFNDTMKQMEVCFFNNVVDVCIESLHERFETLGAVESKFGVLISFPKLSTQEICQQCATLSDALTSNGQSDLNGKELALEMQNLSYFPKNTMGWFVWGKSNLAYRAPKSLETALLQTKKKIYKTTRKHVKKIYTNRCLLFYILKFQVSER